MEEKRVAFDFEVQFSNGGGIKGWDFRLDLDGDIISDDALAAYIVEDLRLLMVGTVNITNKKIFAEKHKRKAARMAPPETGKTLSEQMIFDLSYYVPEENLNASDVGDVSDTSEMRNEGASDYTFYTGTAHGFADRGTSIDMPQFAVDESEDLVSRLLARTCNLEAVVVRLIGMAGRAITKLALLSALENSRGKAILIETGWSAISSETSSILEHPFLTEEAAEYLRSLDATLIGIDSPNVDNRDNHACPARAILLGAGIPIVENLRNLHVLPLSGIRFSAAPLRFGGASATRAWAISSTQIPNGIRPAIA